MSATPENNNPQQATVWQIVMLFLCAYVLGALFVDTAFRLPSEISMLLNRVDNFVCLVFLGDFLFNLVSAKNKLGYLKWGWIDFLSSIPSLYLLRWGRLARIVRILRILRGIRSTKSILQFLFTNRAQGTFATVAMITFVLVVFSSIAVLNFETAPDSNIKTAGDALWWSSVTVATVGYGDYYPVTHFGRIIAVLLMIAGVGLFGTFTAYASSFFLEQGAKAEKKREDEMLSEIRIIREKLDRIEKRMTQ